MGRLTVTKVWVGGRLQEAVAKKAVCRWRVPYVATYMD